MTIHDKASIAKIRDKLQYLIDSKLGRETIIFELVKQIKELEELINK